MRIFVAIFFSTSPVSVTKVQRGLVREVEACDSVTECTGCGVIITGHARIVAEIIDEPWVGRSIRKRRWICLGDACEVGHFHRAGPQGLHPAGLLSTRAIR